MVGGHRVLNENGEEVLAWKLKADLGYVLFERLAPEGNAALEVLRIGAGIGGLALFDMAEVVDRLTEMEKDRGESNPLEEDISFPATDFVSGKTVRFTIALHGPDWKGE